MKKCKNCGKRFYSNYVYKNFCSFQCKKEYRKSYMKNLMNKKRNSVSKIQGYINTSTIDSGSNFGFSEAKRHIFEFQIVKGCCNWKIKQKYGYCVTLHEPYILFRKPCKECYIFKALKEKQKNNSNKLH